MDQPTSKQVQCTVVTPERTVVDEPAEFVALPMYDGELGVLAGRAPLIGRLGTGELRFTQGQTTRRVFVDGGFAQVRGNAVTVLTPRAVKAEDIDTAAVASEIEAAQQPAATPEARATQRQTIEKDKLQLRIASKLPPKPIVLPPQQ